MQYSGRIVRAGERDAAIVHAVKLRLNEALGLGGCADLRLDPDDPNFGPKMTSAVKLFQTRNADEGGALEVSGELDPRTWAALFGAETVPACDKADDPFLAKVLEVAAAEEAQHVREVPTNSNRGPKVESYLSSVDLAPGKPWCCAFAYYCVNQAAKDMGAATPMVRTGGCLDLWQRSAAKGARLVPASAARENPALVKPGMIFIVDHGEGLGHTGFVEKAGAGLITTIEGNTNPAKSREGGGVYRLVRTIGEINKGFIDLAPAAGGAAQAGAAAAAAISAAAPPPLCFKLGSKGDEVRRIQEKLKEKGLYSGPVDGVYGGGTLAAVKQFQCGAGLDSDGVVGPQTWQALFQEQAGELPLAGKPLQQRCLALTGSFETDASFPDCFAGISGDFDGQGLSFGVLQQNLGQGTLQPLLDDMLRDHRDVAAGIFASKLCVIEEMLKGDREDMMEFARSIQHPVKHFVNEPWKGMFKALGRTGEYQQIELRYARRLYNDAVSLVQEYDLWSERAVALMFDIKVQNGSIGNVVKQRILAKFCELGEGAAPEEKEVTRMTVIANLRAEAANPQWVGDVRSRKLCCATGSGSVHGIFYTLQDQFGIGLTRYSP